MQNLNMFCLTKYKEEINTAKQHHTKILKALNRPRELFELVKSLTNTTQDDGPQQCYKCTNIS